MQKKKNAKTFFLLNATKRMSMQLQKTYTYMSMQNKIKNCQCKKENVSVLLKKVNATKKRVNAKKKLNAKKKKKRKFNAKKCK